jgi:hypothetical protein
VELRRSGNKQALIIRFADIGGGDFRSPRDSSALEIFSGGMNRPQPFDEDSRRL